MAESFADLGKIEAIRRLFENTGYTPFEPNTMKGGRKGEIVTATRLMSEGVDFNLVYFPLKHLGYKAAVSTIAELYARLADVENMSVTLGVSAKLDLSHITELWNGILSAAKEHGVKHLDLDLLPSRNGLTISVAVTGFVGETVLKRKAVPSSRDIICVGGNLGAAFFGQHIMQEGAKAFEDGAPQPDLSRYKMFVSAFLLPEVSAATVPDLKRSGIYPSCGYVVSKGLADACKRLQADSGLGVKIYASNIPFEGQTFDLGKKYNIDPVSVAFNGGEDYALMFVVPSRDFEKFHKDFPGFEAVGHLALEEAGAVVVTPDGAELPIKANGWPVEEEAAYEE